MKKIINSKSGLTLIEIIAAMVMIVIMLSVFLTLYLFASNNIIRSGHDTVSNSVARATANLNLNFNAAYLEPFLGDLYEIDIGPAIDGVATIHWRTDADLLDPDFIIPEEDLTETIDLDHKTITVGATRNQQVTFRIFRQATPADSGE